MRSKGCEEHEQTHKSSNSPFRFSDSDSSLLTRTGKDASQKPEMCGSLNRTSAVATKLFGYLCFAARIPLVYAAEFNDDVTNNLFSDLAPLLTLFGEQVAKQFMASSSTWEDNILFAMVMLVIQYPVEDSDVDCF